MQDRYVLDKKQIAELMSMEIQRLMVGNESLKAELDQRNELLQTLIQQNEK